MEATDTRQSIPCPSDNGARTRAVRKAIWNAGYPAGLLTVRSHQCPGTDVTTVIFPAVLVGDMDRVTEILDGLFEGQRVTRLDTADFLTVAVDR
jgi:hypothetical protein